MYSTWGFYSCFLVLTDGHVGRLGMSQDGIPWREKAGCVF